MFTYIIYVYVVSAVCITCMYVLLVCGVYCPVYKFVLSLLCMCSWCVVCIVHACILLLLLCVRRLFLCVSGWQQLCDDVSAHALVRNNHLTVEETRPKSIRGERVFYIAFGLTDIESQLIFISIACCTLCIPSFRCNPHRFRYR